MRSSVFGAAHLSDSGRRKAGHSNLAPDVAGADSIETRRKEGLRYVSQRCAISRPGTLLGPAGGRTTICSASWLQKGPRCRTTANILSNACRRASLIQSPGDPSNDVHEDQRDSHQFHGAKD